MDDLLRQRGHFHFTAAVQDRHLPTAKASGRAGHVYGNVAPADNHDARADLRQRVNVDLPEKIHTVQDARSVFAVQVELAPAVRAYRQQHGIEAGLLEARDRKIPSKLLVTSYIHPQVADALDVAPQVLGSEAVVGNAHAQHAAGHGLRLKDDHFVSAPGQVVGARQARGPGADNGYAPTCRRGLGSSDLQVAGIETGLQFGVRRVVAAVVGQESLQPHDGNGRIVGGPGTVQLAGVMADARADRRQGVGVLQRPKCLVVAPLVDQGDVTLRVCADRTRPHTAWALGTVDDERVRDGLGVQAVDSLALVEALVERIVDFHGTDARAVAASGALVRIDVSRANVNGGGEFSGGAFQADQITEREDLDVAVLGDADQARAHSTHGAVVGGERFVEHGHVPAQRTGFVEDVGLVSACRKVQGCLNTGDPAADDQYRPCGWVLGLFNGHNHRQLLTVGRASVRWDLSHFSTPSSPIARASNSVT